MKEDPARMLAQEILATGGLEVVADEVAETSANALMCLNVGDGDDFRVPGSHQENCARCQALVWVGPTAPATPIRVCMRCALASIAENPGEHQFQVTTSTMEAVRGATCTRKES